MVMKKDDRGVKYENYVFKKGKYQPQVLNILILRLKCFVDSYLYPEFCRAA